MIPQLIGCDLDGTLLRSDRTISARSVEAVARAEAAGVPFVIVTGRPPRWLSEVADALGHRGLAVCANGALVYDLHTETVVRTELLGIDALRQVVAAIRRELPDSAFAVEYGQSFSHEGAYAPRWDADNPNVTMVEPAALLDRPAAKLLVRHPHLRADQLLAAARPVVGERATLTHSSFDGLLEISAAGVTKATGLAALAADRGLTADQVVAFGDMPNDLPMLAWAGQSFAVANAHPDVLAATDEVIETNDEDGVARTLERWF
ncbi:MAG: Cof-type HAD-IIB family hydrolase [Actinomycetota bacterium]|nr:Cof-type HAD-IIB family hydrolase [Actinomycetota bacterium]